MAVEFKTYKPGRTMRIQITASTVCEGQDVEPGQIITAVEDDALTLIGSNKAVALDPGSPGYKQPTTGPDSPPVPDGTYGHQDPHDGKLPADGTDGERNTDGTYKNGVKPKPTTSMGADPKLKQFVHDPPRLAPSKATGPTPAPANVATSANVVGPSPAVAPVPVKVV
jgi:hypothetical protein